MSRSQLMSSLVLVAGLFAADLAPAFAHDSPAAVGTAARAGMSIPQIHDKLTALGYWNIDKIEREATNFEVRASGKHGGRVKLYVDAQTGEITHTAEEGRRRDRNGLRADDGGGRAAADCNERRCRDDLPQAAAATPSRTK